MTTQTNNPQGDQPTNPSARDGSSRREVLSDPSIETWLPVIGYEGFYEVSDFGRIRSLRRKVWNGRSWYWRNEKILSGIKSGDREYRVISLCVNGQINRRYIHQIVAEAFHGPCPCHEFEVAHKDGDPSNNAAHNLRWSSHIENCKDRIAHGSQVRGQEQHSSVLTENCVFIMRAMYASGYGSFSRIGRKFGVGAMTAHRAIRGKTWSHIPGEVIV